MFLWCDVGRYLQTWQSTDSFGKINTKILYFCHNLAFYCKDKCTQFICSIVSMVTKKLGMENSISHLLAQKKKLCTIHFSLHIRKKYIFLSFLPIFFQYVCPLLKLEIYSKSWCFPIQIICASTYIVSSFLL